MDLPTLKRTIFSQYFYSGIGVASGVLGIAVVSNALFGFQVATAAATGAVAVSIVDTPGPVRHKFSELLAAVLLTTLAGLATGLSRESPLMLGITILTLSFFVSMLAAYGKKAQPLSFAAMLMMVLTMGTSLADPAAVLEHSLIAAIGGLVYTAYALALAALLWHRTKQQALAECLYEFARYLEIKSRFFDAATDLDENYAAIITQQSIITERLQTARDFVFRDLRDERDGRLAATLFATIDLYEYILSSQTDYVVLRKHFGGSDVLMFLRDLICKGEHDIERVSWAITRNREPGQAINFKAELFAIAHELQRLRQEAKTPDSTQALEILSSTFARVRHTVEHIEQMHVVARTPVAPGVLAGGLDLKPFLSHPNYSPRVLAAHATLDSPILRHALRMSLAMGCGYLLVRHLPYATHGQWILLTIAVIMRANFSLARQRTADRLSGNLIGCVLTALLLHFVHFTPVILAAVFIAMALSHTFATINYRFTSVAACIMGLLQLHLLNIGSPFLITERVADTFIGAALAYLFSFVLPHWEFRGIPRLVLTLLKTHGDYGRAVLVPKPQEMDYRMARKHLLDALAALSTAVRRMIDEPTSQNRSVGELNSFITLNYLLASQLAATRVLLQRRGSELNPQDAQILINASKIELDRSLSFAMQEIERLGMSASSSKALAEDAASTALADSATGTVSDISITDSNARRQLERRLHMVSKHVEDIRNLSTAIAMDWQTSN